MSVGQHSYDASAPKAEPAPSLSGGSVNSEDNVFRNSGRGYAHKQPEPWPAVTRPVEGEDGSWPNKTEYDFTAVVSFMKESGGHYKKSTASATEGYAGKALRAHVQVPSDLSVLGDNVTLTEVRLLKTDIRGLRGNMKMSIHYGTPESDKQSQKTGILTPCKNHKDTAPRYYPKFAERPGPCVDIGTFGAPLEGDVVCSSESGTLRCRKYPAIFFGDEASQVTGESNILFQLTEAAIAARKDTPAWALYEKIGAEKISKLGTESLPVKNKLADGKEYYTIYGSDEDPTPAMSLMQAYIENPDYWFRRAGADSISFVNGRDYEVVTKNPSNPSTTQYNAISFAIAAKMNDDLGMLKQMFQNSVQKCGFDIILTPAVYAAIGPEDFNVPAGTIQRCTLALNFKLCSSSTVA